MTSTRLPVQIRTVHGGPAAVPVPVAVGMLAHADEGIHVDVRTVAGVQMVRQVAQKGRIMGTAQRTAHATAVL